MGQPHMISKSVGFRRDRTQGPVKLRRLNDVVAGRGKRETDMCQRATPA
jgi:hypothetical protein